MFDDNDILLIERPVGEVMDLLPPNLKQKIRPQITERKMTIRYCPEERF